MSSHPAPARGFVRTQDYSGPERMIKWWPCTVAPGLGKTHQSHHWLVGDAGSLPRALSNAFYSQVGAGRHRAGSAVTAVGSAPTAWLGHAPPAICVHQGSAAGCPGASAGEAARAEPSLARCS